MMFKSRETCERADIQMSETASPLRMPAVWPKSKRRMTRSLTVASDGPNVPQISRWIPVPDVPITPVLSGATFLSGRTSPVPSILDAGESVYVPAGRSALGLALRLAGVTEGEDVLLPAYHCMSMVTPLSLVSGNPVFYRVREDLSVDLEDVALKLEGRPRALIVPNYFGFPQDLKTLRSFCDDHGLVFIEDCAHSFFGEFEGRPLGSYGHYAIGSLTKFFPVREGGCLVTTDPKVQKLTMRRPRFAAELRHVYAGLEDAIYYHRLTFLKPLVGAIERARLLWSNRKSHVGNDVPVLNDSNGLDAFDPQSVDIRATRFSHLVSRYASAGRIAKQRRRNFKRMLAHFSDRRGSRPLITELPDGVVPYMFPLWVDDLPALFPELEDRAVPVQRFGQFLWTGVDENICQVSADFSKYLIQLPCHQDLREDELDWIMETVSSVIASSQ